MGIGGKGIFGMPAAGIFTSADFGDGNITNVGNIALDTISADDLNIGITLAAQDALLIGNTTAVASLTAVTVNGSDLEKSAIETGVAVGDLVHLISGTGATAGYYRVTVLGTDAITLATAPGGSAANIVCNIYKDVILVQATDATDGQRICGYSHQDKPLVIGGDLAGAGVNIPATSNSLGGEDVLIGGKLEVDGATFFDGAVTLGAALHLVLPLHNDSATPTLGFGDGNTGLYESADNTLKVSIAGSAQFQFYSGAFAGLNAGGPVILNEDATAINPVYTFGNDPETGIGSAAGDQLSLIAGGFEGLRLTESGGVVNMDIVCHEGAVVTHDDNVVTLN